MNWIEELKCKKTYKKRNNGNVWKKSLEKIWKGSRNRETI
jgi:hypothetical protein